MYSQISDLSADSLKKYAAPLLAEKGIFNKHFPLNHTARARTTEDSKTRSQCNSQLAIISQLCINFACENEFASGERMTLDKMRCN